MADKGKILESLYVEIRTDQQKLKSEMNSLKTGMKKEGEKLGDSFGSGFKKVYAGIIGSVVLQQTISFVKKSIDLYAKQEAAEKRLEIAYGKNIDALKEYASALQSQTAYGDENIIEAQALIAAFIKEEDGIKKLTKATLDLSAAKGMDLRAAADLLTKSVASETNALSRYGITVEGAAGSSERLNSAVNAINKAFGGQAQAQLETYTGKMQALSNAWGDLLEKLGKFSVTNIFAGLQSFLGGGNLFASFGANLASNSINEQLAKIAKEIEQEYKKNIPDAIQKTIVTVNSLEDEIKSLEDQLKTTDITDLVSRNKIQKLIQSKQAIIDNFLNPIKKEIQLAFGSDAFTPRSLETQPFKSADTTKPVGGVDQWYVNLWEAKGKPALEEQADLWVNIKDAQSTAMGNLASAWASQIKLIQNANSMLQQFLNTLVQVGLQQLAINAIGSFASGGNAGSGILGAIGDVFTKSTTSQLNRLVGAVQANTAVLESKNMSPNVNVNLDGVATVKGLQKKQSYLNKAGVNLG